MKKRKYPVYIREIKSGYVKPWPYVEIPRGWEIWMAFGPSRR